MQDLISMWAIQDSLLQSYRSMFITAQSIIFALGATVATNNPAPTVLMALLGLTILWIWHKVCVNRAIDVTFVQWLVLRAEGGAVIQHPLTSFKSFQDGKMVVVGPSIVWKINHSNLDSAISKDTPLDEIFKKMLGSRTRNLMEKWLPIAFIILWVCVVIIAVYPMWRSLTTGWS